jgi:D-glycero-D-manno-heptose 1,7-bisphosphate phosphatase
MTAVAFLDRDGVLTRSSVDARGVPVPPRTPEEFELLPRTDEACRLLRAAGFRLVVVTNQPDVARGTIDRDAVEEMNERLSQELELDAVRVCWHDDEDGCTCRKPEPGLLIEAMHELGAESADCVIVGDRWRDVEAGRRAGCRTVLVGDGYGEQFPSAPDMRVRDVWEAAVLLTGGLGQEGKA